MRKRDPPVLSSIPAYTTPAVTTQAVTTQVVTQPGDKDWTINAFHGMDNNMNNIPSQFAIFKMNSLRIRGAETWRSHTGLGDVP